MQQDVTFRRIRGRIVPIRKKQNDKKESNKLKKVIAAGAITKGSALALDAANTKVIFQDTKRNLIIEKKKFAIQPFSWASIGSKLTARVNNKKVGTARYYPENKTTWAFSWLGIGKKHRGKGYADTLSKVAATDMKKQGGRKIFNNVVHPGSLKTNWNRKNDTLWNYQNDTRRKISKRQGLKILKKQQGNMRWSKKMNTIDYWEKQAYNAFGIQDLNTESDIFRETKLRSTGIKLKPYRSFRTKAQLGLGVGLAAGGLGYLLKKKKTDNKNGR